MISEMTSWFVVIEKLQISKFPVISFKKTHFHTFSTRTLPNNQGFISKMKQIRAFELELVI